MKKMNLLILLLTFVSFSQGQTVDTLSFFSKSFNKERTVYIHTPKYYKYNSSLAKLPVIYVLDGQHDWFVNPTLSTINYLQYTHEIPEAIVVVIPLENRVEECHINSINGDVLSLHSFITEELSHEVEKYNVNGFNLLIGHSYSASFSLYSYLMNEDFYSAVIAHSPLNKMENLVKALEDSSSKWDNIYLSIGGEFQSKDKYHREEYESVKKTHPDFFNKVNIYEVNTAAHNAVPLLANPVFLSQLFYEYSIRLTKVAEVDMEYKLKKMPMSIEEEMKSIHRASIFMGKEFPMEISQVNGIASRYLSSDLNEYAMAVYERGIELYPKYFEFHAYLGEMLLEQNKNEGLTHLRTSLELLQEYESEMEDKDEFEEYILEIIRGVQ